MVITSPFGERTLNGVKQYHRGVDLRNYDRPIYACEESIVLRMGTGKIGEGYIVLRSDNYIYKYIHVKPALALEIGDPLEEGTSFGVTNLSGTDSLHLHFEIWDLSEKNALDPSRIFTANKLSWRMK